MEMDFKNEAPQPGEQTLSRSEKAMCETRDSVQITVAAGVSTPEDARAAMEKGAEPIGVFCSEALCPTEGGPPDEETLFRAYLALMEAARGGRVIVRICDFGRGGSPVEPALPKESNPALGFCAIRVLLSSPELFTAQLRALLRASAYGRLAVLAPMLSTVDEVLRTRQLLEETRVQLATQNIRVGEFSLGVMVETPAAALISDLLVRHVDFFCIDVDNLAQYALAATRGGADDLYELHSTAVLRLVRLTANNAARGGIWTGVYGEAAADPALLPLFLGLGVTLFAPPPALLEKTRALVRETDISTTGAALVRRLDGGDAPDVFDTNLL